MELASSGFLGGDYVAVNMIFFNLHACEMLMYVLRCVLTLYLSTSRYDLLHLRYDMPALGKKALKQNSYKWYLPISNAVKCHAKLSLSHRPIIHSPFLHLYPHLLSTSLCLPYPPLPQQASSTHP